MYSLAQSARIKGSSGEPLPSPFKGLTDMEVEFRRGEFSLVAAGPGTGKSLFALNLALHGQMPVLYWSADSNAATQLSRSTAILTKENVKVIKSKLIEGDFGEYEPVLGKRWWIRFGYDARPSPASMEKDLQAYYEIFGCFPHLCILDNITNVDAGASNDAEGFTFGLEALCEYLNEMARETQAHVLALHHVIGEYSDGLKPIPLSGVKGKIGRVPSLILTIHRDSDDTENPILNVSPVKNREGFVDASGNSFAQLQFDKTTMRLSDVENYF
ncbi:AAA family ATPase [Streptomyces sp. NPDC002644]